MKCILAILSVFVLSVFINNSSYKAFASPVLEEAKEEKQKPSKKVSSNSEDINLEEDIPGIEDNYYRNVICCWRISEGIFDALAVLSSGAGTFIGTLAVVLDSEPLKIAAPILGGVATLLILGRTYSQKAVNDRRNKLREIIREHHRNQRASMEV